MLIKVGSGMIVCKPSKQHYHHLQSSRPLSATYLKSERRVKSTDYSFDWHIESLSGHVSHSAGF